MLGGNGFGLGDLMSEDGFKMGEFGQRFGFGFGKQEDGELEIQDDDISINRRVDRNAPIYSGYGVGARLGGSGAYGGI